MPTSSHDLPWPDLASLAAHVGGVVNRAVDEDEFSGVCCVVRDGREVYHEAFGLAHRGFVVPNRLTTRFDIASVTKLFTAVAMVQCIERGDLALDTPLIPFLGLEGTAIPETVTVFHALTHTSGIADDADEEAGEDYADLFIDSPNYRIRETTDFLPNFAFKEPNFLPGAGVRYNNCAYVLLGLAIERATGMAYRDVVRERVFAPAGMTGSDFLAMDIAAPDFAEHYTRVDTADGSERWQKNIYSYPPIGSPDGGATVPARDLVRFIDALRAGLLVGETGRELLLRPHVLAGEPTERDPFRQDYGFGFEFLLNESGAIVTMQKDGINAGVAAILAHYPQTNTTVAILANQDCNVWAMQRDLRAILAFRDAPA
ncbi:MAG: serine hydrolase domain-containing protein [Thermomicrobiales bacterium]